MIISEEEKLERLKLVSYCNRCDEWYKFTDDPVNPAVQLHSCGSKPSSKIGFQLTTQRTFNPASKKLSKAKLKQMGLGA